MIFRHFHYLRNTMNKVSYPDLMAKYELLTYNCKAGHLPELSIPEETIRAI